MLALLQVWLFTVCLLTVRLASRYIMRSLRCRIGVAVSPVAVAAGFGVFATPLVGVEFVGRCVIGFVPWDHALGAGGFLRRVSKRGRHDCTV